MSMQTYVCACLHRSAAGFFVPFIYLIDYARDMGIDPKQGAYLLSMIGVSNTLARVLCGYISDKPWADPLKIYNWALIIGGTATMGSAWLTSYVLLSFYAVIFGLCVGECGPYTFMFCNKLQNVGNVVVTESVPAGDVVVSAAYVSLTAILPVEHQ